MRKKLIVANWKMNMTRANITDWFMLFAKELKKLPGIKSKIILAPSFIHINTVQNLIKKNDLQNIIYLAAQDVSQNDKGSYTGDVGAFQIKEFCDYAIVGHSETQDKKELIEAKRDKCLRQEITPIICARNIEFAIDLYIKGVILALEDPKNISEDGHYKENIISAVKHNVDLLQKELPKDTTILYGGSVNRQNAQELANIERLDGVLVGNACLEPAHFIQIIEKFELI